MQPFAALQTWRGRAGPASEGRPRFSSSDDSPSPDTTSLEPAVREQRAAESSEEVLAPSAALGGADGGMGGGGRGDPATREASSPPEGATAPGSTSGIRIGSARFRLLQALGEPRPLNPSGSSTTDTPPADPVPPLSPPLSQITATPSLYLSAVCSEGGGTPSFLRAHSSSLSSSGCGESTDEHEEISQVERGESSLCEGLASGGGGSSSSGRSTTATPQGEAEETTSQPTRFAIPIVEAVEGDDDDDDGNDEEADEGKEKGRDSLTAAIEGMLCDAVDSAVEGFVGEEETCVVCYEDSRPSQMETTECNHRFCKPCLARIRDTRPFCPLCRQRIGEDPAPAYPIGEDSVLHLLVRLLTMSHSAGLRGSHAAGQEARRALLDIVLGIGVGGPRLASIQFEDLGNPFDRRGGGGRGGGSAAADEDARPLGSARTSAAGHTTLHRRAWDDVEDDEEDGVEDQQLSPLPHRGGNRDPPAVEGSGGDAAPAARRPFGALARLSELSLMHGEDVFAARRVGPGNREQRQAQPPADVEDTPEDSAGVPSQRPQQGCGGEAEAGGEQTGRSGLERGGGRQPWRVTRRAGRGMEGSEGEPGVWAAGDGLLRERQMGGWRRRRRRRRRSRSQGSSDSNDIFSPDDVMMSGAGEEGFADAGFADAPLSYVGY